MAGIKGRVRKEASHPIARRLKMKRDMPFLHSPEIPGLYEGLERKRIILRNLQETTKSLCLELDLAEAAGQDMSRVAGLLDRRQECIQAVDRIDGQIEELRSRMFPTGEGLPEDMKEKISSGSKEMAHLLQGIRALDQECTKRIARLLQEVRAEQARCRHRLKTIHCYSKMSVLPTKFMDAIG